MNVVHLCSEVIKLAVRLATQDDEKFLSGLDS